MTTRVHLTVSLPVELWTDVRNRWPNRKASHIVATALQAWLTAHPPHEPASQDNQRAD